MAPKPPFSDDQNPASADDPELAKKLALEAAAANPATGGKEAASSPADDDKDAKDKAKDKDDDELERPAAADQSSDSTLSKNE